VTRPCVVVTDSAGASADELKVTAKSVLDSSHRPTHWIVARTDLGHERVTRMRDLRRTGIIVARDDMPLPQHAIIVFVRAGDALLPGALASIAAAFDDDPDTRLVYGDSLCAPAGRFEPDAEVRRPRWSPERLRSHNYVGSLLAATPDTVASAGGLALLATAHEHDRSLRLCEVASPVRIDELLYRCPSARLMPSASIDAVRDHCERTGITATVHFDAAVGVVRVRRTIPVRRRISVIMPTRGTTGEIAGREVVLGAHALRSLLTTSTYRELEIVVVFDHDTPQAARTAIVDAAGDDAIVIDYDKPFNFAEKMNLGAVCSTGDYLLFLNDDTEIVSPDALETLAGILEDPTVAMAGPMLLYEDGLIQSAGHLLNPVPYDLYRHRSPDHTGAQHMLRVQREVSGVIAAFALVRRTSFTAVGGLCTKFPSNYNDVDFSLKIQEIGQRVVWTPHATVLHFESRTRSPLLKPFEVAEIGARWRDKLDDDPYSNPHLERYQSIWKQNAITQESMSVALGPIAPIASK
jgi:GT2 family glycosyltransferase